MQMYLNLPSIETANENQEETAIIPPAISWNTLTYILF